MKQRTCIRLIDWLLFGSIGLIAHTQGGHSVEEQENKCVPWKHQMQCTSTGLNYLLHVPRVAGAPGNGQAWAAPSNPHLLSAAAPRTCASSALGRGCRRRKAWDLWEGSWELRALTPSSRRVPAAALSHKEAGTANGCIADVGQEEREGGMETSANCEAAVIMNKCS